MAQSTPLQFNVPDMDCEACIASITAAIHRVEPNAAVSADLTSKLVIIGGTGDIHDYMHAVQDAGFTVEAAG
jgi:copper chaperone CopZ